MVLNSSQLIIFSVPRLILLPRHSLFGLPAYAQLAQVFAEPLRQLYRDPKLTAVNRDYPIWQLYRDPKLSAIYRDFIWAKSFQPFTGILQKLMPARAAVGNSIKPPGR
jgi:hypothetical protein